MTMNQAVAFNLLDVVAGIPENLLPFTDWIAARIAWRKFLPCRLTG
jgi:hypothetical protein